MTQAERARRLAEIEAAVQRHKALTEFEEPAETVVEIDPDTMAILAEHLKREWKHDRDDYELQQRYPYWNAG
jgi:hypothetical protein